MTSVFFALFSTAIGRCAIVWNSIGILALMLPGSTEVAMLARIGTRFPAATEVDPTPTVDRAIRRIVAMLAGHGADLSGIALDMRNTPQFYRRVYAFARQIPFGATLSYGELAARLGSPKAARAVGQALGRNPWALIVPCHRVLAKNGKLTGFSAHGGIATKRRLLRIEGIEIHPSDP